MNRKGLFLLTIGILTAEAVFSQTETAGLRRGIELYGESQWREAVLELRRVQAASEDPREVSEALYWIGLSELSAGEYEAAIQDFQEAQRLDPAGNRAAEIPYHTGRALFYAGNFEESIVILKNYSDQNSDPAKKVPALYWIGESLFSLGRLDDAREVFTLITDQYPYSLKYEAAAYRLALINEKKIELELLGLLKQSHEESIKNMEEYQRRERSYDQELTAYQRRVAGMIRDTSALDAGEDYRLKLAAAEERIAALEALLSEADIRTDANARLRELKDAALRTRNRIESSPAPGAGGAP
jgi:TolA-binding protein